MTEEQKESFDRVIEMLHSCEGLLGKIYESFEAIKQNSHLTGQIDMNYNYHQFNAAWNQYIANMARAANNLHFLRQDFEPQTERLAEFMERVKNNPLNP